MAKPGEHKTVQARILAYAQEIGWTLVPRAEAEARRGFDPNGATPEDRARTASLYFGDLLHDRACTFNPDYKDAEGALVGEFQHLHADITGNRDFLGYLRNQAKFFDADAGRELDLQLIDYSDISRPETKRRNVYEVTEEWTVHNGRYGTREDVVFLINGIPVLVIECKNASKGEAIALGVDQIRRYHEETPEVMVPEMLFTATEAIGFAYGVTWNLVRRNLFNWRHDEGRESGSKGEELLCGPAAAAISQRLLSGSSTSSRRRSHSIAMRSNAIVKDITLLKQLFKAKMETKAPDYLALVTESFDDKDVDTLIEHFRNKDRRKEFFTEYKEIEMLYEIISPDAFLRDYIDDYTSLSAMYAVVRNAFSKKVYVDRAFQKKTNDLVQKHIDATGLGDVTEFVKIDAETIDVMKQQRGGDGTKVINLVKSIERTAEEENGDPFLVALADRAKAIQESFEDRQSGTADSLDELLKAIKDNEERKKEQAARGLDALTYFLLKYLADAGIPSAEDVSKRVAETLAEHPNWQRSEAHLREVRQEVTFALVAEEDDLEKVTATVERLFNLLLRSFKE